MQRPYLRQAIMLCLSMATVAPLGGCVRPRVNADALRVEQGTIYTANMRVSEGSRLTLTRLPKALREDERVAATFSLEMQEAQGTQRYDVDIRKLNGGYGAETAVHETKRTRTYLNVSHTKEQDWLVGVRWRLRF